MGEGKKIERLKGVVIDGGALERLRERFEGWRRRKATGEPIPPELLMAAKGLAGRYRPGMLAKALRLHYRRLVPAASRRDTAVRGMSGVERFGGEKVPAFVKWRLKGPEEPSGAREGSGWVEFENPRGFKARIYRSVSTETIHELLKGIAGVGR